MVTMAAVNREDPFWINNDQMGLSPSARARLQSEGLTDIRDFADFKEAELAQAIKNIRVTIPAVQGIPAVVNANGDVVFPAILPIPAKQGVVLSAKCSHRLKIASRAYHYFKSIERSITSGGMHFENVLKDFNVEYEAVIKLAKEDKPEVPKITKNTTPLRWIESFNDCLFRTFGIRDCPLSYVVREESEPAVEADDPLLPQKSYGLAGSVIDELIKRLTHNDPLFKSDNATVYSILESATRGTVYAPTVKPYARKKDGRRAYFAMTASHLGEDKWERLQKENLRYLMNTPWTGKAYGLEKFTGMHRAKYVQLEEAVQHVEFQLPTQFTRVQYLLENIKSTDPYLAAAMGAIRLNQNGMRNDFEKAVAHMLPVCPYTKSKGDSSNAQNPRISASSLKNSTESRTGVDFRWYKKSEFAKLTDEQRDELKEWQRSKSGKNKLKQDRKSNSKKNNNNNDNDKNSNGNNNRMTKKQLFAEVKELRAKAESNEQNKEIAAYIASVVKDNNNTTLTPTRNVQFGENTTQNYVVAAQKIQKIIKRKRDDVSE